MLDIFAARQPVFDAERRVVGYELLYRTTAENRYPGGDPNAASEQHMEHVLLGFGLPALAGDRLVFVNASRAMLLNDSWRLLPAPRTVLEVLETIEPTPDVVAACARARGAGYRIALDDFQWQPGIEALLDLAHVVKLDFLTLAGRARVALLRRLRRRPLQIVAEKLETYAEFEAARTLGCELFQGYFFARPEMLHARDVTPSKLVYLRLLGVIHEPEIDFSRVERVVREDVALTLKLLRYLQSAAYAATDIASLRQALLALGETQLRRWAALVAVLGMGRDKPSELLVMALARARFCELLAPATGLGGEMLDSFLVGLLSVVDALVDQPLEQALAPLGLAERVRAALLRREGRFGALLGAVEAWERGLWEDADRAFAAFGVDSAHAQALHAESLLWAEDIARP